MSVYKIESLSLPPHRQAYDRDGDVSWLSLIHFERNLKWEKGNRLLDVGCGNGRVAKSLKKYFKEIIGVDPISYDIVKDLDEFIHDDFETHIFNGKFDIVLFLGSFYQMKNKPSALKKAKGLLTEKGRIVIIEDVKFTRIKADKFGLYELDEMAKKLGLNWVEDKIIHEVEVIRCSILET